MSISTYRYNIARSILARGYLPISSPRYKREKAIIDEYEAKNAQVEEEDVGKEKEETLTEVVTTKPDTFAGFGF